MRRARRLCALAVVLVLTASVPLRQSLGCNLCPPGCPMHTHAAAGAGAERRLGCHRAPARPRADVCVRSACGRDAELPPAAVLIDLLAPAAMGLRAPRIASLARTPVRVASLFPPEPPTEPPRVARG